MDELKKLFRVAVPVLAFINTFGGLVAGVWLILTGEWWAIGFGALGLLASHWLLSILMIPSLLLGAAGAKAAEAGDQQKATSRMALGTLYLSFLMGVWCVYVTMFFLSHDRQAPLLPMLIWSYVVSTSPWVYFSAKDQQSGGNEFAMLSIFFLQLGFVVGAVLMLAEPNHESGLGLGLGIALTANWVIQQRILAKALAADISGQG